MDIDRIRPELREPLKRATLRIPTWVARVALPLIPVPHSPAVRVRTVRLGSGVRLRVYEPTGARTDAALLWIHGGGLLFGDARQDEALCLSTAQRLGIVIVSANYRLAPRHPFPAAHEDLHTAWRWLLARAGALGVSASRLAIGGESAGAGLAAGLVQRLHDEGGIQPVAQWLFAPMLDDRTAAQADHDAITYFVWDNARNREGWSGYLGVEPGAAELPAYASPARREDLSGLPPTFLTWTEDELFADEDRRYAERLSAAGVPVITDVVAGAAHGFENWAADTPVAQALVGRAQDWLRAALGITG